MREKDQALIFIHHIVVPTFSHIEQYNPLHSFLVKISETLKPFKLFSTHTKVWYKMNVNCPLLTFRWGIITHFSESKEERKA